MTHDTAPPSRLRTQLIHHTVSALLVSAILAISVWSYLTFSTQDFFYSEQVSITSTQPFFIDSQLQKLQFAAQTYKRVNDSPPMSLQSLVDEGLIASTDLTYPYNGLQTPAYKLHLIGERIDVVHVPPPTPPTDPEDMVAQ